MHNRILVATVQIIFTALILACIEDNIAKTIALLSVWVLTFWPFSRKELLISFVIGVCFGILDIFAVGQGDFAFTDPDTFGIPVYEWFIWGFYFLNAYRVLGASQSTRHTLRTTSIITILFVALFFFTGGTSLVSLWRVLGLFAVIACFHSRDDILYCLYFIALGTIIELIGIASGEWQYATGGPLIPLWYLALWGGAGILLRRLFTPFLGTTRIPNNASPATKRPTS